MTRQTPPLHAKGVYRLKAPWVTQPAVLYECIAIRSYADFIAKGDDVAQRFYVPYGLTEAHYREDLAAGAHIVTLRSETSAMLFVPDTYIESYPDLTGVEYKRIVLSVLLAPLPDSVDLTHLKTSIGTLVSDITGVTGEVAEHAAPNAGMVTADEHATLEVARQAAIINRTIDRARLLEQQVIIDAQAQIIDALQAEIIRYQATSPDPGP